MKVLTLITKIALCRKFSWLHFFWLATADFRNENHVWRNVPCLYG